MSVGKKVVIILVVVVLIFIAVILIKKTTPDKLEFIQGERMPDKTPYKILRNGEFWQSGYINTRADLVGKGEFPESGDGKNTIYMTHLYDGVRVRGISNGQEQFDVKVKMFAA